MLFYYFISSGTDQHFLGLAQFWATLGSTHCPNQLLFLPSLHIVICLWIVQKCYFCTVRVIIFRNYEYISSNYFRCTYK